MKTNFFPLRLQIKGINVIQTPYGYLPEEWVWNNLDHLGIYAKDHDWGILCSEHDGINITIAYNNFNIAIKKAQIELKKDKIDLEILNYAKAKNYKDEYLPSAFGFDNYSALMREFGL